MAHPHNAVDYGRQRALLQSAQTLVTELRSLPLDPATTRGSYPRMFELVRLVKRYSEATAALPAGEARAMWEQRGQWLQEEVAGLAQERIYSPDQQQYWLNLLLLLFAGAEACDRALREKLELELAVQSHTRHVTELQEQLRAARAETEQAAQRTAVPPDLAEELLALRSKVAVLGTELDKGRAEVAAAQQQMQLLVAERDSLRQQADATRSELTTAQSTAASRQEVIQQLMQRTEVSTNQGQVAAAELNRLQVHCRTLSVNLETNAKVIEKLVELNSELMDSLNTATATAEFKSKQLKLQQQQYTDGSAPAVGPASRRASSSGGYRDGAGGNSCASAATSYTYTPPTGAGPPPPPVAAAAGGVPKVPSRNGFYGAGSASTSTATAVAAAPTAGGGAVAGSVPRVASRSGEAASLTDAFAAFLKDETPPKPATADVLAAPPPLTASTGPAPAVRYQPGAGSSNGGGSGGGGAKGRGRGMGFGLMSVVRYVAGSDRPAPQGQAVGAVEGGAGVGPPLLGVAVGPHGPAAASPAMT